MISVGIVAALDFEARTLGNAVNLALSRCRPGGEGCTEAVSALARSGSDLIISWGTAGGLSPRLSAGDLCLPDRVLAGDGAALDTDDGWRNRIRDAVAGSCRVQTGPLLHAPEMVLDPAHKHRLAESTGAVGVDMESLRIGEACAAAGLPFLVLRAIVDQLDDRLPEGIDAAIDAGGALRPGALMAFVARRPGQWHALVRLSRRYRRARASLATAAGALDRWVAGAD